MSAPLLDIQDLHTHFPVRRGWLFSKTIGAVRAVDGVSLQVPRGEVLGLVGESGCGKSTLARSVVGLVPPTSGHINFEGRDLARLSGAALRRVRPRLQMIFQDPYASLNPRMTVSSALAEPLRAHHIVPRGEIRAEVARLMETVGLAPRLMRKYPHEFSGGQRQRIAIARALALRPDLVIADEPVSALDVSVQAQILNLLKRLSREMNLTMIFISHDLGVVRHMAQRIAVMYLGHIVELGPAEQLFNAPRHPYTRALLSAIPRPDPDRRLSRARIVAQGDPPSPMRPPTGCPFHPRCPWAIEACQAALPAAAAVRPGHSARCIRLEEIHNGT